MVIYLYNGIKTSYQLLQTTARINFKAMVSKEYMRFKTDKIMLRMVVTFEGACGRLLNAGNVSFLNLNRVDIVIIYWALYL